MKKGKGVLGIICIMIIMVSIISVNAGLKDWLGFGSENKDLEGELANTEPATATLNIEAANPPVIVYVSEVDDGGKSLSLNTIKPDFKSTALTTNVIFYFIAQSAGGIGVLYTTGAGDSLTNAKLISPAGVSENLGGSGGECVFSSAGVFTEIGGQQGVKYTCTIAMDFWASPGTIATLNPWGIEVSVTDQNAQQSLVYNTKQFDVEETVKGDTNINAIDWGTIAITVTNKYTQVPVIITNEGNGELSIGVTGANVRAADFATSGKQIPADRFRVTNLGAGCTGGNLLDDAVTSKSSGLNIVRGANSNGNLYSCITSISDLGLTAQTYNSRTSWIIAME